MAKHKKRKGNKNKKQTTKIQVDAQQINGVEAIQATTITEDVSEKLRTGAETAGKMITGVEAAEVARAGGTGTQIAKSAYADQIEKATATETTEAKQIAMATHADAIDKAKQIDNQIVTVDYVPNAGVKEAQQAEKNRQIEKTQKAQELMQIKTIEATEEIKQAAMTTHATKLEKIETKQSMMRRAAEDEEMKAAQQAVATRRAEEIKLAEEDRQAKVIKQIAAEKKVITDEKLDDVINKQGGLKFPITKKGVFKAAAGVAALSGVTALMFSGGRQSNSNLYNPNQAMY